MKTLLFIPVLGLAFLAASCRTSMPIDPSTGDPRPSCLPGAPQQVVYPTK